MSGRLWSHFGAMSGQLGFTVRLVMQGGERPVVAGASKWAKQTHSWTASGVWCSRRLVPWLRDYKQGMTGDGTQCTHQELTIHHIKASWEKLMWPTERHWKQRKKGKGGGGTQEEELCVWVVNDWKELYVIKKACQCFISPAKNMF